MIPAYVADMVTLLARLDAEHGGLGRHLDGRADRHGARGAAAVAGRSPVRRLVLNDVGPAIEPAALARIGAYVGQPLHFETLDEAADYLRAISPGFGPHTREQWLALTRPMLKRRGRWLHACTTTRAIAVPFRAITPELAQAGEAALWHAYDALRCPTLLLRGADSDLLSPDTARAMTERGPKARLHRVRRRRPCADARPTPSRSPCCGSS